MKKGTINTDLKIKLPKGWLKVVEKYEKSEKYSWLYEENVINLIKVMLSLGIQKKNIRLALADLGYKIPEGLFYTKLREDDIFKK